MPRDGYYLAADPLTNYMDDGVDVGTDGTITVRRKNMIIDQFYQSLGPDGMPQGIAKREGARDDGYHVFVGEDPRALMRQTFEPWPSDRDHWSGEQALVNGPRPPTRSEDTFPLDSALAQLTWRFRPDSEAGYPAGLYWYCVAAVSPGGALTETTEPVQYNHPTDGAPIVCPLPADLPEGAENWAIFLSRPNGARDTIKEQRRVSGWLDEFTLTGPWRNGRDRPMENETFVGRPQIPRYGRRGDFHIRHAVRDMEEMWLRLVLVEGNERGTSLPSAHSKLKRIKAHKNHAVEIHPDKLHPDTTYIKVYAQVDRTLNPTWHELIPTHASDKARGFAWPRDRRKNPILMYGLRDTEGMTMAAPVEETGGKGDRSKKGEKADDSGRGDDKEKTKKYKVTRYLLIEGDPPTEDTTGIEDPQGEASVPTVGFGGRLPTGKRLFAAYCRVFNGQVTQASRPVGFTIPINHIVDLILPPRVNLIPNSHSRELNKNNQPVGWEFGLTSGTTTTGSDGKTWAKTVAVIPAAGIYPSARMPLAPVRKDQVSVVRGFLEVIDYGGPGQNAAAASAGSGKAAIWQYDDNEVEINGARINNVAVLDRNGYAEFRKTIAGADVGGTDLVWHDDAAFFRLVAHADGANRNLSVTIHSGAAHPFHGAPPRYLLPAPGQRDIAVPTLDPTVPYHNGSLVVTTVPGGAPGGSASSSAVAVEKRTWETGGLSSWGVDKSPQSGFAAELNNSGAINGSLGFWSSKQNTQNKGRATIVRTYGTSGVLDGTRIAHRFLFAAAQLPSYKNSRALFADILAPGTDRPIASLEISQTGGIRLLTSSFTTPASFRTSPLTVYSDYVANQVLDIELQVLNAGTNQAEVIVTIGPRGATRRTYRVPASLAPVLVNGLRLGGWSPTDSRVKWQFRYDDTIVTDLGWPNETTRPVANQPVVLPDRPRRAATPILSPTTDATHAVTPARTAGSLRARVSKTATPAAIRTPLQIRDAAGNFIAQFRLLTDNSWDFRAQNQANVITTVLTGTGGASLVRQVELEVENAGTANAYVHFYRWASGETRERLASFELDLTGRTFAQAVTTDAAEYDVDQRFVYADQSEEFVEFAPDGSVIQQIVVATVPDDSPDNTVGWELEERFVKPGVEYTFSIEEAHDFAPLGVRPVVVLCWDEDGNGVEVAELFPGGVGQRDKAWTDVAIRFTPPDGYWRMTTGFRDNLGGTFKFQRPLLAPGDLTGDANQAARDALRNEEYVAGGTLRASFRAYIPDKGIQDDYDETITRVTPKNVVVPAEEPRPFVAESAGNSFTLNGHGFANGDAVEVSENGSGNLPPELTEGDPYYVRDASANGFRLAALPGAPAIDITGSGLGGELFGVGGVAAEYRHSPLDPPAYPPAYGPASAIPAKTMWVDERVYLSTTPDRLDTPVLPPGSLGVTFATHRSVLNREDRTPLPGGVLVTGLIRPTPVPMVRSEPRPGGHSLPVPITDPINRADALMLDFFNPRALEEFLGSQTTVLWTIDHVATGNVYLVQLDALVEVDDPYDDIHEELRGFQYVTVTAPSFEILEVGSMASDEINP